MREIILHVAGEPWFVERREVPVTGPRRTARTRPVLLFRGPGGELRRGEIASDFPQDPPAALVEAVWRNAEVTRAMDAGEMMSAGGLVLPRARDWLRLGWRAVVLSCPNCGGRPVLRSWFRLRDVCPRCELRLERGEGSDYFLGGLFFNLVLAELTFAVILTVVVIVMWPHVPWDTLQYSAAAAVVVAPIVLYPVSKLLWLAFDLALRPVTPAEMAWHRAETAAHTRPPTHT